MAEENQTEEPAFGLLFEQSLNLDRGTGTNMPTSTEEGVEREIMASEFNDISGAQDPIMAAADAAEKRWAAKDAAKTDAPQFKTFGEAFKHHRKSGDKTFEWKGETFTTVLRSERAAQPKSAPKAAAKPTPKKAAAVAEKPAVAVVVATPAAPAPKAAAPAAPAPAAPTEKPKRLLQFWGGNVGETRSPYAEATQRIKDTFDPAKAGQRIMNRNKHGAELM
ncbi:MAG: hypothetical protein ACMV1D_07925 [Macromonas sp.]